MADGNADYDSSTLAVAPVSISEHAKTLKNYSDQVVSDLETINGIMANLALGWAGATADEAQAVTDHWNQVMQELFGTTDHPEYGVLNVMLGGVQAAAAAYSQVEAGLQTMFFNFESQLNNTGDAAAAAVTPTSAPQSTTDSTYTAVTEEFPG
jgi:uncharacterized protein YukE